MKLQLIKNKKKLKTTIKNKFKIISIKFNKIKINYKKIKI